tara:strand:- start:252 stop:407 length:156 start_codon:yes stop_codon:yes gene_type:complete
MGELLFVVTNEKNNLLYLGLIHFVKNRDANPNLLHFVIKMLRGCTSLRKSY